MGVQDKGVNLLLGCWIAGCSRFWVYQERLTNALHSQRFRFKPLDVIQKLDCSQWKILKYDCEHYLQCLRSPMKFWMQACKGGLEIIETRRWRNHWRSPRYCIFHDHMDIGNESHICSDLWISTAMLIPKSEENLLHFFQALIRKASRFSYVLSSHWYEWFSVPDIENLTRLEIEGVEVKFCTEENVDRGAFDSYNLWCPA